MTEEEKQLAALREQAVAELATIETTDGLDEWRTRYLGRERGELSAILKGLGRLPGDQRKQVGQAANLVKVELEGLAETRRAARPGARRRAGARAARCDAARASHPTRSHASTDAHDAPDCGDLRAD